MSDPTILPATVISAEALQALCQVLSQEILMLRMMLTEERMQRQALERQAANGEPPAATAAKNGAHRG